jgi:hypothetical protein
MPEEAAVRKSGKILGEHIPRTGEGRGKPDSGRVCTHADRDTTEILGSPGGRIYQREECDRDSTKICREAEELYRAKLLGRGSTVGWDKAQIRKYILEQEAEDKRLDQLDLFKDK